MNTVVKAADTPRKLVANLLHRARLARAALRRLEATNAPAIILAEARGGYLEAHNAAQATIQLLNAITTSNETTTAS